MIAGSSIRNAGPLDTLQVVVRRPQTVVNELAKQG